MTHPLASSAFCRHDSADLTSKILKNSEGEYGQQTRWVSAENSARGETAMWVAVITQAMMDALSRSNQAEVRYHREEAIRWLTGGGKDFVNVCVMADFDPSYIRMMAKRALASPKLWRAEPGKGKRYAQRKAYRDKLKAENEAKQSCLETA